MTEIYQDLTLFNKLLPLYFCFHRRPTIFYLSKVYTLCNYRPDSNEDSLESEKLDC